MMADIRRQDSVHHFVPNMVDKIGYPLWQQAATNESSSSLLLGSGSSVFLIPFQDEKSKRISAYLSCVQTDGKYNYSLHTREAIINRINKADTQKLKEMAGFGLVLAYFEKQVNKRDTLVLQGCKLPVFKNASISFQQSQKPRNLSELVWITICGDVLVNSNGQVIGVAPGGSINYGNMQYGCNTSTQWVQSFPADGSGGGGIGGDPCIAPDGSTYWWCTAGTGGGGGGYDVQFRTIAGITYSQYYYPGMDLGLSWEWFRNAELSSAAQQLADELDGILDDQNSNGCYPTLAWPGGADFTGTIEHMMIQAYMMAENSSMRREYSIPLPGPVGGRGRADLVDISTGDVWEIKPIGRDAQAQAEASLYVQGANLNCPRTAGSPWRMGKSNGFQSFPLPNPKVPGTQIWVSSPVDGFIQYENRTNQNSISPSLERSKLIELIRLLVKSPVSVRDLLMEEYFRINRDVVVYLRALSIGICIGTIVEDFLSAGAGTMDDAACFALAYRLWRFSQL